MLDVIKALDGIGKHRTKKLQINKVMCEPAAKPYSNIKWVPVSPKKSRKK